MTTSIEKLMQSPASAVFDDPAFKVVLEDHLTWFINHPNTMVVAVTAHQIDVYDFDWIGLLMALNIPVEMHWLTIRMNGGMSLTDVPALMRTMLVPSYDLLQNFIMLNTSNVRIK